MGSGPLSVEDTVGQWSRHEDMVEVHGFDKGSSERSYWQPGSCGYSTVPDTCAFTPHWATCSPSDWISVCHPAENQILEQRGQRPAGAWYKNRKAKTQEAVGRFFMLRAGNLHVVLELEEGRKGGKGRRKYQAAYLSLKFFILEKKKRAHIWNPFPTEASRKPTP